MNISQTRELLDILMSVGIEEVVVEPFEDATRIRGSNKDNSVLIFFTTDEYSAPEYTLGVQSVRALNSRVSLFGDSSNITIEPNRAKTQISRLLFKEGRKSASFRCGNAADLTVPSKVPGNMEINERSSIILTKEYVDHLSSVIASISQTGQRGAQTVSIEIKDEVATITVFDGEDDSFTDQIEVKGLEDKKVSSWEMSAFQRVMKQSLGKDAETLVSIADHGVAVFPVGNLNILVRPIF